MCTLQSSSFADECLAQLPPKERAACESKYARMAASDSVEVAAGLSLLLNPVSDWAKHPDLKSVRKIGSGRHRLYFTGEHEDCTFTLVFMLVHKRKEDDTPNTKPFQDRVLKALRDPQKRIVVPPASKNALETNPE